MKTSTAVIVVVVVAAAAGGGYYLYTKHKEQSAPQQSGGLLGQVSDFLHSASSVLADWKAPSSGPQQDPARVSRPYTTTLG